MAAYPRRVICLYVNGIDTSEADARSTARQISHLAHVPQDMVLPVYNGTLSPERVREVKRAISSALAQPELSQYVLNQFLAFVIQDRTKLNPAILQIYDAVQREKHDLALHLLARIRYYLRRHYYVVIVAHSQGTDIVHDAFQNLNDPEREQLDVFALGGMTRIPGAENLVCSNDHVMLVVQIWSGTFKGKGTYEMPKQIDSGCDGHGINDYLRDQRVKSLIRRAMGTATGEDLIFLDPPREPQGPCRCGQ